MEKKIIPSGETIYTEGDPSSMLYLIKSGEVQIIDTYPETGKQISQVLGSGNIFGEVELIDGKNRTSTAQAKSETKLLSFTRDEIIDIIFNRPEDSLVLGRSVFDHLSQIYGSNSLESDIAKLRQEMNSKIKDAVISHEARVLKSHNGMAAIGIPIVLLAVIATGLYFYLH